MRATARKIINTEPKLKPIIFVDYLQIIHGDYLHKNRTEIVGQISNELKQMAKEFNCPVVCLSQLNRGVEIRDNKRPVMSDLRDSGNIEQDADVIGFPIPRRLLQQRNRHAQSVRIKHRQTPQRPNRHNNCWLCEGNRHPSQYRLAEKGWRENGICTRSISVSD